MQSSRDMIMKRLVEIGEFNFAGYIQNEVRATTLVLFKAVAKYYEIPFYEANEITKKFAEKLAEPEYTGWLKEACDMLGFDWEDHWDMVERKMEFCYKYNKIPYNNSTAASGVIMIDGQANVPVRDGVVMYNGSDLENNKYIKYDILTVTTLDMIQHFYGLDYNWNDVYDDKVWDTICSGDTDFVFQFGSPGMKNIIKETQPRTIDQLAEINALWRPGPIEAGFVDKYIQIKKGEQVDFTEEELILRDVLKEAFGEQHPGLVIFQEDVMRICQDCAGFTMTEADDIRKAMGRKNEEVLNRWKVPFIKNWNRSGDPEKVWDTLAGFAHYAFNKSHSVAYAVVAYATAKIWTYHRNELLEYCLNDGTKDNYALAMDKCKELGIRQVYPDITNMKNKRFEIKEKELEWGGKRTILSIPIGADENYDSYVSFLFSENNRKGNLILKGVCDDLTGDRIALSDLASYTIAKARRQAVYMEPESVKFTKLEQILDGLKACGGLKDWEKLNNGDIVARLVRARGNQTRDIVFHNDYSGNVRAQKVYYDLKMFGAIRDGVLSDRPYIETNMLERQLNRIKERAYNNGRGDRAYYLMRDHLQDYMYEYFSIDRLRIFPDIYALITDITVYRRSVKLFVEFNDCNDILYVSGDLMDLAMTFKKNTLVKMTLEYSPYINKRREEFIYDFDILQMEEIK